MLSISRKKALVSLVLTQAIDDSMPWLCKPNNVLSELLDLLYLLWNLGGESFLERLQPSNCLLAQISTFISGD